MVGDKSGGFLMPPPESILPNLHMEPYAKSVVIGCSKAISDQTNPPKQKHRAAVRHTPAAQY